jgi:hypothetical protein
MNFRSWIFILVGLYLFFFFFSINDLSPSKYVNKNLASQIILSKQNKDYITIDYEIINNSLKNYSSDEIYFSLVIGKVYNAPGFIIYEFTKDLNSKEVIRGTYNWKINNSIIYDNNTKMYFNTYKKNKSGEWILAASAEKFTME